MSASRLFRVTRRHKEYAMSGPTSLSVMLSTPLTQALRKALASARDPKAAEDLLFLERWELASNPGTADALRGFISSMARLMAAISRHTSS